VDELNRSRVSRRGVTEAKNVSFSARAAGLGPPQTEPDHRAGYYCGASGC